MPLMRLLTRLTIFAGRRRALSRRVIAIAAVALHPSPHFERHKELNGVARGLRRGVYRPLRMDETATLLS